MIIDEKIKELEERQEEIRKEIEELKKEKEASEVRWRAQIGDVYYYFLNANGSILATIDNYLEQDNFRYLSGNYFKTETEAIKYKSNLITYQQLKDIALRLNEGLEFDWDNGRQDKYYIYFDYIENEFGLTFANSMRSLSEIYCLDEKFLDIALDEIGEERLKQLLEKGI